MEFKSVFPARKYYKYSETEAGTVLATGIYKGPVEGTYGTQHIIREADGTEVVLNKAGHLDFLLAKAGKGTTVQVVYLGEGIVTKGKFKNKKVHNFDVQVATTQEGDNTNE